ncbi:UNVERIFIED_ORG: hypothetical protein LHK14_10375 [Roseateles sp. XES5]|nr:hypothetical protein [Roseateles sp. XES5]
MASGDTVRSSAQGRIDAAVEQIEQALSEMHPGWRIDKLRVLVGPQRYVSGGFDDLPHIHVVALFAHNDADGFRRDFRWHYNMTDVRA